MQFQCNKCRYKFSNKNPTNNTAPARCPWCMANGTVTRVKSADDLIRDVDDMVS